MIPLLIFKVLYLSWGLVTVNSQEQQQHQPQQVLPVPQQVIPYPPVPAPYGAYLQQVDAAGAQALPVQHSFTVNHSPYTFYPRPEIFSPQQQISPVNNNPPPVKYTPQIREQPIKYVPERREHPVNVQPYSNQQPIQFLSKSPQYTPQQIQRQLKPNHGDIQIVPAPNLGNVRNNNLPIHGKISRGRPPVQPYLSQGEKFKQQAAGKNLPVKPIEEKYYDPRGNQDRRVHAPPPPIRNHPQRQQPRRKEEDNEEEEEESKDDSEEESEEEDESGEESESEEEEEHDGKGEASDLPPEHNRNEYDFDNRNYHPTFDAGKYIFSKKHNQKRPGQRYHEEEVPRYHRERGYGYVYRKNTKSKPQQKIASAATEPLTTERPKFVFYDSEPKFKPYEPNFETFEPPKFEKPKRIKAERVEIENGKPTYYYYSSPETKPNNTKTNNSSKDAKPQATRKKMIREKWYVHTKET